MYNLRKVLSFDSFVKNYTPLSSKVWREYTPCLQARNVCTKIPFSLFFCGKFNKIMIIREKIFSFWKKYKSKLYLKVLEAVSKLTCLK